jgi:hypothetical protein
LDITARTPEWPTFMDLNATAALTYGPSVMGMLSMLALVTGVWGGWRVTSVALRLNGGWRWLLSVGVAWLGAALVTASMVGATWLGPRWPRGLSPLVCAAGSIVRAPARNRAAVGWAMSRAGRLLPKQAHPVRHQALTWSATLPAWIVLAGGALVVRTRGGVPLGAAAPGRRSSDRRVAPVRHDWAVRIGSVLVLAVSADAVGA